MNRNFKKVLCLFILLMFPFSYVKAECSSSEIVRLTKMANNVNISYVFDEKANATFDLTINNLTSEIYMLETTTNKKYSYDVKNNEITINGVAAGSVLKFEFYTTKKGCYDDKLVSRTITLPSYNPYYKDFLCEEAKEHYLCERFTKINVSRTQFESILKEYINRNKPSEEPTGIQNMWLNLFIEYYWVLYGVIILSGTTVLFLHYKKNKLF